MSGGFGIMLSFPVSLAVYWLSLTYLFSMDAGDSWLVVMLLSVFDMIVRWALLFLLLALILNWGGVSLPGAALGLGGGAGGGGSGSQFADMRSDVQEMKDRGQLEKAEEFIEKTGHQTIFTPYIKEWRDAGCKNIWFSVSRDINGRMEAGQLIIELPKDKASRATCYEVNGKWIKGNGGTPDKDDLTDDGAPYLMITAD